MPTTPRRRLIEDAAPEPMEVAAEELEAWTPAASDAAEEGEPAESVSPPDLEETSGESPFEFGIDADLASSDAEAELEVDPEDYDVESIDEEPEEDDEQAVELAEPATPELQSPEEPIWYAGLIIQNQGKLERIISWDRDRLIAGRSRECEIFLDQAEISRRHAMFVREDERYEVRDLDSINGVLVNGEKIRRRDLEVGDVVKIEDFELTFLLDRQPIASEIVTDELAAPVAAAAEDGFDMTMIDEHLPIGSAVTDPSTGEEPPALVEEEAEMPEDSLFGPDDAEKEELVEVEAVSSPPSEVADPAVPVVTDDVVTFELRVRVEDLPRAPPKRHSPKSTSAISGCPSSSSSRPTAEDSSESRSRSCCAERRLRTRGARRDRRRVVGSADARRSGTAAGGKARDGSSSPSCWSDPGWGTTWCWARESAGTSRSSMRVGTGTGS